MKHPLPEVNHVEVLVKAIRHILEGALIGRNVLSPPDKELLEAALVPPVAVVPLSLDAIMEVDTTAASADPVSDEYLAGITKKKHKA